MLVFVIRLYKMISYFNLRVKYLLFYLLGIKVGNYKTPVDFERIGYIDQDGLIHVPVKYQRLFNPNDIYTVRGEYQMSPQSIALDEDTPEVPTQFHDLIWYRAMEKHATDLAAPEVMERATLEGRRLMRALEANQLPIIGTGDPLV